MLRIALVNAPLRSVVCDYGVGHQLPLGLLMVGGPLLDAGFLVTLVDAARDHLNDQEIVRRVGAFRADVVMTAHVGSTPAHPSALRMLHALKSAMPRIITVYGGVHPTYHYRAILARHPEVDVIVRGEGEAVARELALALNDQAQGVWDLARVPGVAWRRDGAVVASPAAAPLKDLAAHRTGWELIDDWDKYQAFGLGRSAVVQFSRGCPHSCTYCGQWMFWKRWRYRDVRTFVDEVEWLHREHQVRFFWLADENPTTIKETWQSLLEEVIRRKLDIAWSTSIRAQDIVRDADILHLYKQAGFLYVLMGIEAVTDENLNTIRKGASASESLQAVQLLRQHDIMSVVDYIFGIEDETPRTLWRAFRGLLRYDGDFVNALYMTPHAWTPFGGAVRAAPIVQNDLARWDYRHQILAVKHLTPTQLFAAVKLIELCYHLQPRRLWRALTVADPRLRQQLRQTFSHTSGVFLAEIAEHVLDHLRSWRHRRRPVRRLAADTAIQTAGSVSQ